MQCLQQKMNTAKVHLFESCQLSVAVCGFSRFLFSIQHEEKLEELSVEVDIVFIAAQV